MLDTVTVEDLPPNQALLALKQTNKNSQKEKQTESGTKSNFCSNFYHESRSFFTKYCQTTVSRNVQCYCGHARTQRWWTVGQGSPLRLRRWLANFFTRTRPALHCNAQCFDGRASLPLHSRSGSICVAIESIF